MVRAWSTGGCVGFLNSVEWSTSGLVAGDESRNEVPDWFYRIGALCHAEESAAGACAKYLAGIERMHRRSGDRNEVTAKQRMHLPAIAVRNRAKLCDLAQRTFDLSRPGPGSKTAK